MKGREHPSISAALQRLWNEVWSKCRPRSRESHNVDVSIAERRSILVCATTNRFIACLFESRNEPKG